MDKKQKTVPRRIWTVWFQGVSAAPYISQKCIGSWIEKNPTWEVVVLNFDNLGDYVQLAVPDAILKNLSLVHLSDLLRLALLSEYGGVWVDATVFCTRPLDEWIDDVTASGFFAFHRPGSDRLISSWFIASEKKNPIVLELYHRMTIFWIRHKFNQHNKVQRKMIALLSTWLNRSDKTTKYWFHPVVTGLLKIYPYFVLHYTFERVVATDSGCKEIWDKTKKVSADLPHRVQQIGFFTFPSQEILEEVYNKNIPMFKLTWKYDHDQYTEESLLHYILEQQER